jgi:hypothetical protein
MQPNTAINPTGLKRVIKGGGALAGTIFLRSTICYPMHKFLAGGNVNNTVRIVDIFLSFKSIFHRRDLGDGASKKSPSTSPSPRLSSSRPTYQKYPYKIIKKNISPSLQRSAPLQLDTIWEDQPNDRRFWMKFWGLNNNTLANISLFLAPERSGAGSDRLYFLWR